MRLYLSSQRLASPDALMALLRGKTRIGVIANAADDVDVTERTARSERECRDLAAVGLDPVELDLREHFDDPDDLGSELARLDAVWVLGGNVVALRTALHASGADVALRARLLDDSIVYAGYSAGACVLGPAEALSVASLAGELPGYPEDLIYEGLGLLPYAIVPHHGDGAVAAAGVEDYYIEHHIPFIALRDGEVIVLDGDDLRVVP